MTKQKDIFLHGEGDAWFERNHAAIERREFDSYHDPVIRAVQCCMSSVPAKGAKLLEVGCGEGKRLQWINQSFGFDCYGVEPSEKAIVIAQTRGVHAVHGYRRSDSV